MEIHPPPHMTLKENSALHIFSACNSFFICFFFFFCYESATLSHRLGVVVVLHCSVAPVPHQNKASQCLRGGGESRRTGFSCAQTLPQIHPTCSLVQTPPLPVILTSTVEIGAVIVTALPDDLTSLGMNPLFRDLRKTCHFLRFCGILMCIVA